MAVTPKPIVTPRIVQPGERRIFWRVLLLLVVLAGWSWFVYDLGGKGVTALPSDAPTKESELEERVAELERERAQLQLEVADHARSAQIERDAAQKVQDEINSLLAERAALEKEVALLKGVVSDGGSLFQVKDLYLEVSEENAGEYHYGLTVTRRLQDAERMKGELTLSVVGTLEGKSVTLTMEQVSGDGEKLHQLGFRHYQILEGILKLPQGFAPASLMVDIKPGDKKDKPFSGQYEWPAILH